MKQSRSCWSLAALLLVMNAHAQPASAEGQSPDKPAPQQIKGLAAVAPTPSDAATPQNGVAAIAKTDADSLQKVSTDIANLSAKLDKKDYMPAIIGFFGVLVGGLITVLTQLKLLAHQKTLAKQNAQNEMELANLAAKEDRALALDRAKLEIGNSFVQWQLKQLSELYGPLHALLQQSQALYRHMNTVLAEAEPNKFRLRKDPDTDRIDGIVFEICLDGWRWERFRTVLHVDKVYGQDYGVEDYFDGVAVIGGRIVKVIEEKAGYARPEQPELVSLFGKYLAHYAVLERLNAQCRRRLKPADKHSDAGSPRTIRVDDSAVFPAEIQNMVATGFRDISKELDSWRAKASS